MFFSAIGTESENGKEIRNIFREDLSDSTILFKV